MRLAEQSTETALLDFAPGVSEMAHRARAVDWRSSALGPPSRWQRSQLRALAACLTAPEPVLFWCGPARTLLYNDACIPLLGTGSHPGTFAKPGSALRGLWERCGRAVDAIFAGEPARWDELIPAYVERSLPCEEIFLRMTFIPVHADDGSGVAGVFCPCSEITADVLATRRSAMLSALWAQAQLPRPLFAVARALMATLVETDGEASFAALYLTSDDGYEATCAAAAGRVPIELPRSIVPVATTAGGPPEHWAVPVTGAALVPVTQPLREERLLALLLIGGSPHRPVDSAYGAFLMRVAACIGAVLVGAAPERRSDAPERSGAQGRRPAASHEAVGVGTSAGAPCEQLAYASSVTAMGELTASLTHHLNQSLAAVVTNAQACVRWLGHTPPNLAEVGEAAQRIAHDAHRASRLLAITHAFLSRARRQHAELAPVPLIRAVLGRVEEELSAQESRSAPTSHLDRT